MLESFAASVPGYEVALGLLVLLPVLTYLYWRVSNAPAISFSGSSKLPPVEGGWIPWLGCALAFGKEPLWFIKKTQEKV